ncbi:MAG: hypothetical protein WBJ58_01445, partial [Syntrophales bacterium]
MSEQDTTIRGECNPAPGFGSVSYLVSETGKGYLEIARSHKEVPHEDTVVVDREFATSVSD